jgi:hypothetical protein
MTTIQEVATDDDAIRELHLKYIAEISKAASPPRFKKLTADQQDFLDRKGRYARHIPLRDQEEEQQQDQW